MYDSQVKDEFLARVKSTYKGFFVMQSSCFLRGAVCVSMFVVYVLGAGFAGAAACPLVESEVNTVLTDLIFAVFDLDENGYVTVAELGQISAELADSEVGDYISKWENGISRWWVNRALETFHVLSFVDTNDDGLLQFEEVSEYLPIAVFMYLDLNDNMVIDCEDWALITADYTQGEGEEDCGSLDLLALVARGAVLYIDENGDDVVGMEEVEPLANEYAPSVYVLLDSNGDTLISDTELAVFMATLPLNVVALLDQNGDGVIRKLEVALFVPDDIFDALDSNGDNVLDCRDAVDVPVEGEIPDEGEEPPVEGEEPPVEGEEPPVEGEPVLEGEYPEEGELTETPCPLPPVSVENVVDIALPYADQDGDGGLSMDEIVQLYPGFEASWFEIVDTDSDDVLSRDEILFMAGILIVEDDLVPFIDVNGDRLIQYSEVSGYLGRNEFNYLDMNGNDVLDCEDLFLLLPIMEGEWPPIEGEIPWEGEWPPLEGEFPWEGEWPPLEGEFPWEGEPVEPCGLPPVSVENVVDIALPYADQDGDGGLSMDEIVRLYPGFEASWFDMIDTNSDDVLSRDEILSMARILIVEDDLVPLIDVNGDRLIQYSEVSGYLSRNEFNYLDMNGNEVLDCEDLALLLPIMEGEWPPIEGECEEVPVEMVSFSGRTGYALMGPYSFRGELTKEDLNDPVWHLSGEFSFPSSGYTVLEPVVSIAESYPEQVTVTIGIMRPSPDTGVLDVITPVSITAEIAVSNGASFEITTVICTLPGVIEGELPWEGEYPWEGEPVEPPCGLPPIFVGDVVNIGMPYADVDGDGGLSMEEIVRIYPSFAASWFEMIDLDSDDLLSRAEILSAAQIMLTDGDIVPWIDDNDDRLIQYAEVSGYMNHREFMYLDFNRNDVLDCEDLSVLLTGIEGELPPMEGEIPGEGEPQTEGEMPAEGEGESGDPGHDWEWPPYWGERCVSRHLIAVLRRLFLLLDTNEDGVLSYEEIRARMMLPQQIFEILDSDGDTWLTWEELIAWRDSLLESGTESVVELVRTFTGLDGTSFFSPGEPFTVHVQMIKHDARVLSNLNLTEVLPEGWQVDVPDKADAAVSQKDVAGARMIHFNWEMPVDFPITISYIVTPPADAAGIQTILGQIAYQEGVDDEQGEGLLPSVLAALLPEEFTHSADTDHDWRITLNELLRVIQLYNGGAYHWSESSEDGYAPGAGTVLDGWNHQADYSNNWRIELEELLRMIQLYNSESRYYYISDRSEDGYTVAPF